MSQPDLSYIHESLQHIAIPISGLTPDPMNARKHDRRNLDAIKASLDRFGMRAPIVVQRSGDAMIVRAGNGRMAAALELGWSHLPATVFDEDDNEAVAFAVADNRTAELAEWDWDNLSAALGNDSIDWSDLKLFEDEEIQLLTDSTWQPSVPDPDAFFSKEKEKDMESISVRIRLRGKPAHRLLTMAKEKDVTPEELVIDLLGLR